MRGSRGGKGEEGGRRKPKIERERESEREREKERERERGWRAEKDILLYTDAASGETRGRQAGDKRETSD